MPRYERLSKEPQPSWEEIAFTYSDEGSEIREHWVCYCVSPPDQPRPRRYAVAYVAAEDTDFYDYRGLPPDQRGLEIYAIYRVHDSEMTFGYNQHHIIICLADKTIELVGEQFSIRGPLEGESALKALFSQVKGTGALR